MASRVVILNEACLKSPSTCHDGPPYAAWRNVTDTRTVFALRPLCGPRLGGCSLLAILAVAASTAVAESGGQPSPAGVDFFESRIRPVLVQNCYECHSARAKDLQGGLRLDSRDAIRKGGESGPAVVPGNVDGSLLVRAVRYEDHEMPPKGKLPAAAIADLTHG